MPELRTKILGPCDRCFKKTGIKTEGGGLVHLVGG